MKRLCLICLALALLLCGCRGQVATGPEASPTDSPAPTPVLAFFGASNQPWCQDLAEGVGDWCGREGWELIEYDCVGLDSTQAVQVDDLLRSGGADLAVLCAVGSQEELEARTDALTKGGVATVTLSHRPMDKPEKALCHLGPDREGFWSAASVFFRWEEEKAQVLLLRDTEDDPLEEGAAQALEATGAAVLEEVYTWGDVGYAQMFLALALDNHSGASGVLCFSRTGALGAREALDEAGRDDVRLLCLDDTKALRELVEQGELDALATVNARALTERLEEALTQAAQGQTPESKPLGVELWEGET